MSLRRPLAQLIDRQWSVQANRWGSQSLVRAFFAAVSRLGDGAFWYALMLGLVLFDGWLGLRASIQLAATGLLSLALYVLIKRWTRRPRPFAADDRVRAWIAPLDEFSFPSGHTLHAVAFSLVACAHYPALAWLVGPFTACVAASRVVLGLHYPSDVLAAIVLGSGLAGTVLTLAGRLG